MGRGCSIKCKLDNVSNVSAESPCAPTASQAQGKGSRAIAAGSAPPLEELPPLQKCRDHPKDTELQEQSAFLIFR